MATTDDLRAMLPADPNGWPPEEGWYVISGDGCRPEILHTINYDAVMMRQSRREFRHAPLRLETGATAQAELALHLAGFGGGILDAVGALLGDRARVLETAKSVARLHHDLALENFALRARVAELEARRAVACEMCIRGYHSGGACEDCGAVGAVMVSP